MMDGLNDIEAKNVQPPSTTSTMNNTPAGTNPTVSTTTTPPNVTGVSPAGTIPAVSTTTADTTPAANTTSIAGTIPTTNTTTPSMQDMAIMIASLQTTIARLK